jgi:hypothetical protein
LVLGYGLVFLSRHDTASGHVPLLVGIGATLAYQATHHRGTWLGEARLLRLGLVAAWAVPLVALAANLVPEERLRPGLRAVRESLVRRCRFAEVPADEIEKVATWCRENTPLDACFIGPPGPKSFRLWSRRNLAFNRAGSPYSAAGLADWARRFADHVGLAGSPDALVAAYQRDRHGLEREFDRLSDADLAALAQRQGAGYVIARARRTGTAESRPVQGSLVLLHTEGRYAVYRVDVGRLMAGGVRIE